MVTEPTLLFENEEIYIFDKPSGLASQGGAGIKTSLIDVLAQKYNFKPFLVHRLDQDTSGCIIVAKDADAVRKWMQLLEGRALKKKYTAVCEGTPNPQFLQDIGKLTTPVTVRGVDKDSLTFFKVIQHLQANAPAENASATPNFFLLLELELATGRGHQLRIQLARAGAPILGDDLHGNFALNKKMKKHFGLKKLLLHAHELTLPSGEIVRAALPIHFTEFLEHCSMSARGE